MILFKISGKLLTALAIIATERADMLFLVFYHRMTDFYQRHRIYSVDLVTLMIVASLMPHSSSLAFIRSIHDPPIYSVTANVAALAEWKSRRIIL